MVESNGMSSSNIDKHNVVLLSVKTFPPNFTGAGLRAYRFSGRMHDKYKLYFSALCTEPTDGEELQEDYLSVKRVTYSGKGFTKLPSILFSIWKIYRYLKFKADNINIIHFFSFGIINRLIMMINICVLKKNTILEVTQDGDDDPVSLLRKGFKNKILRPWTIFLLNRIDCFIVQSQFSYDSCLQMNVQPSNIWHRPNPIDEKNFASIPLDNKQAIRKKLNIPDKFVMLNIGLIQPRKNQLFLCECIKHRNCDDDLLLLIGPAKDDFSSYETEINSYLSKNGIEGKVKLLGHKDNINEYMVAADVLVFASKREGFCNVLAESAMSGLPVISLYLNGFSPYITYDTGVMLTEQETLSGTVKEKFVGEIELLKKRYKSIDRHKIRDYGVENFSAEKIDSAYNDLYNNL